MAQPAPAAARRAVARAGAALVNQILEIVLKLAESGVSIVLVEQNVNFALEICDYAYVLENGALHAVGPGSKAARRSAAARGLSAKGVSVQRAESENERASGGGRTDRGNKGL